jgi:hypothetical protein
MLGILEQIGDRGLLDDLAGVHDRHPVAHLGDDTEVVGDEDHGRVRLALEGAHEIQDLRLDGDVQRSGRLVGDEELRLEGQRHRDHDALRHPSRQLVRKRLDPSLRIRDADHREQLLRPSPCVAALHGPMKLHDLANLHPDVVHRVQAARRLLKDHADPIAPQVAHVALPDLQQVLPVEEDLARLDPTWRRDEAQNRQARDALSAAGLADEAHHFSAVHVEVEAGHRTHDAVRRVEAGLKAPHLEEPVPHHAVPPSRRCHLGDRHRFSLGSRASRIPSPRRLKARTEMLSAAPGKMMR